MTSQQWQQIKELFHSAIEREPRERAIFLDEACRGDTRLRREVESLINAHEREGSFIDSPAYEVAAELLVDERGLALKGQGLGSYRVLSTLGRGGMGEVYLAEDQRLGRKVALKLLPVEFTKDADRLRRFEQEARAASALNHPNIITIYEIGELDRTHFIVTEFIEGETLRQRLSHTKTDLPATLQIIIQVTDALSAAHKAGIIHRDIKPENIMVRPDGYVKVLDFGLAKLTERSRLPADAEAPTKLRTASGIIIGTVGYMSPEQARGLEVDERTDIFSLGTLIYEMVAGRRPFDGETPSDTLAAILKTEPPPVTHFAPDAPAELVRIVSKALRKDREERYQVVKDLLLDLKSLKEEIEFEARLEHAASGRPSVAGGQALAAAASQTLPTQALATDEVKEAARTTASGSLMPETKARSRTVGLLLLSALGLMLIAGVAFGLYKLWGLRGRVSPFQTMKMMRLTNHGKAIDAAISPDGKYFIYVLSDAGKQSLWIRQVSAANDTQVIPPAQVGYFGITFSPDGNSIYYAIKATDAGALYRIPVLGGTPVKLLEKIDSPVSFSPDGKRFALVRGDYRNTTESSLVVANADGSNEQVIATRRAPSFFSPIFFTGPSWSPDGQLVSAAVQTLGGGSSVIAVKVQDATEQVLTPQKWTFIGRVQWVRDMSGLIIIGQNQDMTNPQVWFLSYPEGSARLITNDLNSYRALSFTADSSQLITIQTSGMASIWVAPGGDAKRLVQLPTGNVGYLGGGGDDSVAWMMDGRIVYVSSNGKISDVWIMDSTGGNRKQLTNGGNNRSSVVSPDGRYIVFTSYRKSTRNIWRMDIDGGNQKQLTEGLADIMPSFTPDGRWVVYTALTNDAFGIFKVPIDGGAPVKIADGRAISPVVSPDGRTIAYLYAEYSTGPAQANAPPNKLVIAAFDDGARIKTFDVQYGGVVAPTLRWSQDGRSLLYTVTRSNVTNIWSQPLDGSQPKQLTDFKEDLIATFDISRDGSLVTTRAITLRDAVLISEK